jgi:hypothetical protein
VHECPGSCQDLLIVRKRLISTNRIHRLPRPKNCQAQFHPKKRASDQTGKPVVRSLLSPCYSPPTNSSSTDHGISSASTAPRRNTTSRLELPSAQLSARSSSPQRAMCVSTTRPWGPTSVGSRRNPALLRPRISLRSRSVVRRGCSTRLRWYMLIVLRLLLGR